VGNGRVDGGEPRHRHRYTHTQHNSLTIAIKGLHRYRRRLRHRHTLSPCSSPQLDVLVVSPWHLHCWGFSLELKPAPGHPFWQALLPAFPGAVRTLACEIFHIFKINTFPYSYPRHICTDRAPLGRHVLPRRLSDCEIPQCRRKIQKEPKSVPRLL